MAGASVALFARRPDVLRAACDEVGAALRLPDRVARAYVLDASSLEDTRRAMAIAEAEMGEPDILLNCVGRAYPNRFEDLEDDALRATLDANLVSAWNTVRVLLPSLKRSCGHIVNTASLAGFVGVYGFTDYCASKFAVMGFSEALRAELVPAGVGVSVLCPPDTQTPGFEVENRTKPAETRAISEGAKLLAPDAVAEALMVGLKRGRRVIVPGFDGRMIWIAKRLFPGVVDWIMNRAIRRARA